MKTPLLLPAPSVLGLCLASLVLPAALAEEGHPLDSGLTESVDVQLVVLDVQVLDRKGNPVPGLTAADFDVSIERRELSLASFDARCAESSEKPAVVLAFDYQHLDEVQRGRALESARRALARDGLGDLEVMVVALTGGLRVEQPFTPGREHVPAVLGRMRDDVALRAGNFAHLSEEGFVRGLTSLFDVVGAHPAPKAILLYSAMEDVPLDTQFQDLSAMAAASRSVIYPYDVRGLGVAVYVPTTSG